MKVPTPQEQVEFLQKIQRLLMEGMFVASYKFALLLALADLAVLKGDDSGAELELSVDEIAEIFIELYWRHTRPFITSAVPRGKVLKQNTGKQAAVIQTVISVQEEYQGSLSKLRRDPIPWKRLVRKVAKTVASMPLWKLQRTSEGIVDFLYANVQAGRTILLKPGVAYCLRKFYGIVRNLIEGAWVNHVRSQNLHVFGQTDDLGSFLFGAERAPLSVYRPILEEVQKGGCFYCHRPFLGVAAVDHFIPWSKYPIDLGHNFVLAHTACNTRKGEYLAAEEHLGAWVERNDVYGATLNRFFARVSVSSNLEASVSVARWAYSQAASANGCVWVKEKQLQHLGSKWTALLSVAV